MRRDGWRKMGRGRYGERDSEGGKKIFTLTSRDADGRQWLR